MTDPVRLRVGDIELTRVQYFDIPLDPAVANLTSEAVRAIPWAAPHWATDDAQVLIGQALWFVVSGGRVVVVDPCGASDEFLRTGPDAVAHQERVVAAVSAAGFAVEDVDTVVLTHLDGIGMAAAVTPDGGWAPLFPDARIVMTRVELEYLATHDDVPGLQALRALIERGVVDGVEEGHEVAPGVCLSLTAGHSPGHAVLRLSSRGEDGVMLGHLAITPLQFAAPMSEHAHLDARGAQAALDALIAESANRGTLLIGPLWPEPGAVTVDAARTPVSAR
jgi:glyoxylase-like metal-dependent hydrolase (beta-lactamase superfamily II)